ncbi:glycosyltransferase family 2 protein [Chlorobium phaeobacteroides]|uniref:Glycosyl transferase, family 2 n=1 Tax=Chlorobium phaeobacteroides (strain DSM 266 / SMG 266 / 2430) TaxID=290317 RepID=A1BDD6_CHLPD|nr:glycosyltransferase [Chlorobium phaeobacteroides]ABL64413.1 glycosyl transferase, family 2 [Chlorobium phaeobacteroides DSM 266]
MIRADQKAQNDFGAGECLDTELITRNNDLQALLSEQERRIYDLLQQYHKNESELRSVYNTPIGKIVRYYKTIKQKKKTQKNAEKNDYNIWLNKYDLLTEKRRKNIIAEIATKRESPLISVFMRLNKRSLSSLEQSVQSVKAQLYPHWELCIIAEASQHTEAETAIRKFVENDARITRHVKKETNTISEASNAALELAGGEFFALLESGDTIHPLALYHVAQEVMRYPEAGLLYSDEDSLDNNNKRVNPFFKPDFNYDLFLCQNMVGNLAVFKTSLARQTGGFKRELDGAQDYDLALRFYEKLKPEQIRHIPRVLYHKRISRSGTIAATETQISGNQEAALLAVNHHLKRTGIEATVEKAPEYPECNRIRYTIPNTPPSVDIIIPTKDMANLLKICVLSILAKTTYNNYSITIIDNGSKEQNTLDLLKQWKNDSRIRIIRDDETPFNYSKLNNRAVHSSSADFICLMNNDIEIITPEWLNEMMGHAIQPGVGAVGARLWYPNATLQHAGVITGMYTGTGHAHKKYPKGNPGYFGRACLQQEYSAVTGACLLINRINYLHVAGLNEQELTVAFNDIELCLKLKKKGLRNIWTPYAEMFHHESLTRGRNDTPEKKELAGKELAYMQNTWGIDKNHDPAYNPNLSITSDDFSLSWPPRILDR